MTSEFLSHAGLHGAALHAAAWAVDPAFLQAADPGALDTSSAEALARSFARFWLPEPRQALLLAGPLLAFTLVAARFAGWLRSSKELATPYTRKVFHFLIFTAAGVVHVLWGRPAVTLFGSLVALWVLYAVWRGDGHAFYEAMARPTDQPHRSLFIVVPLVTTALGGVTANLLFPEMAYVGYMVCGWGDAVAEPVGTRWGRHRYTVPSLAGVPATRSLEGSAAVLSIGGLAAAAALALAGLPPGEAALVGLACGVGGAAVEAISNHGLDNFTVQVAAAAVAAWLI